MGFLTTKYTIRPIIPVRITTISHSTPLMPRFSASLYTHIATSIHITSQIMGRKQKMPVRHANPSVSPCALAFMLIASNVTALAVSPAIKALFLPNMVIPYPT
jgi:hypothetical protein